MSSSNENELSSNEDPMNSQRNTESVSNQFSVERRSREFIWKTFIVASLQIAIVWEICAFVLLTILGTLLQLEMLLIPQLQFAFPYNYMYLIVTTIIIAFPAAVPLIDVEIWWTFVTWIITMLIAGIVVAVSVLRRFDLLKSFGPFILATFVVELFFCVVFFPFIYFQEYDILIMLCGFAMIWTVISEIAIIIQALLGDRRFTFRNDQHVLCGLVIGTLIVWLHLLVSTEVAIFNVPINLTGDTSGGRPLGR
uniref:Uncharacterized protein n=1 Tax=Trichobilharzia regenti TaxID=157069 RepID=A0AA85K714_TRIRE|nr:unnamed protein product [Trichobilharzia regenti]